MSRLTLAAILSLIVALPACAQQDQPATRIYVAYYQIGFGDLLEWIDNYRTHSIPVLDQLVEEGVILNHNARMHNTGGNYNFRQGIIGNEETDFDAFWEEYLGRTAAANPAASERASEMMQAHADEIWNLDVINLGDGGGQARYLYDAQFQVDFTELQGMGNVFDNTFRPAFDQLLADGVIAGYVVQSHNTGGDYNWKTLILVNEWDNIDELQEAAFGAAPLDSHPFWSQFRAHKDELWEALPPAN